MARFVAGYTRVRRLEPSAAAAIPVYLKAHGLKLITRWVAKGWVDDCTLPHRRVEALAARQRDMEEAINAAIA